MRVLLTGAGGPAARSLARQLQTRGHWVGGVDLRDVNRSELDSFALVSPATDPAYLTELADLVAAWEVDAVIPSVSEELLLLARTRDELAVPVVVADPVPVAIAADKLLTARALQGHGIDVPAFALPSAYPSADAAVEAFGGPVIVKPRVSRGGRGVRLIMPATADRPETTALWATLDDSWILQAFAPGTEYAPVLHRMRGEHDPLCIVLEKTELKEGVVGNAVATVRSESVIDDDVRTLAVRAVCALDLTGPVDIDVRREIDGRPVVLEINARFGANSAQAPELLDRVLDELEADSLIGAAWPTGAGGPFRLGWTP